MIIRRRKKKKHQPASELLQEAVRRYQTDTVTVAELMHALHERGFGLLLVLCALPNCLPIPSPGVLALTSVPMFFLAWQMVRGQDYPSLPRWIASKRLPRAWLARMVEKGAPWMKKIERFMRPRGAFAKDKRAEKLVGLMCFPLALSIAIPFPFTNFGPSYGVLVMSLGLLSRDGVVIVIGVLVGVLGLVIAGAAMFLGVEVMRGILY